MSVPAARPVPASFLSTAELLIVAPAAVAMVWKWMFNSEYGIINTIFHTNINWLTNPDIVIITLAIVVWTVALIGIITAIQFYGKKKWVNYEV